MQHPINEFIAGRRSFQQNTSSQSYRLPQNARIDGRGTVVDRTLQSVNPSQFVKSQMPYRQMPYRQMPSRQEAHRVMPYLIDAFIS